MGLPDQELFTVQEVATRWGKSESYVEEQLRKREFKYVILECELAGSPLIRHLYFDKALWPYGESDHQNISGDEVANFLTTSVFLPNSKWSDNGIRVCIPRATVEDFERKYEVRPVEESAPPVTSTYNWIHSKRLRIAVEAYYELYVQKKLQPKQAHKKQIRDWLNKYHPKETDRTKDLIATMVNPNEKGGAPSSQ